MNNNQYNLEDQTLNLMTVAAMLGKPGMEALDQHSTAILRWTLLRLEDNLIAELEILNEKLNRLDRLRAWNTWGERSEGKQILKEISL